MPIGRNDPCPCGSGRKYKQCCLARHELVDARWQAWRRAEGTVVPAVMRFAAETWGQPLFDEAGDVFFVGVALTEDEAGAERWDQLYAPWFVFDFVPAPRRAWRRSTGAEWPATMLALEYARRHEADLTSVEARFLRTACDAPLSFMVVTAVQLGRSLDLKDILTGEAHRVLERSASSSLQPGSIVLARVVADGDIAVMSGLGPYPLPPSAHNRIIDFREQFLKGRGPLDRACLKASALEIVLMYRQLVDQMLNPAPPKLQNTDGDPLAPTTLVFELRCGVREAFDRLKGLSITTSEDELLEDASRSDSGELTRVEFLWSKKGNKLHPDWDNTTLGNVTLSTGAISVSVNSARRAKKVRGLIEKHLGRDALFLRQTIESVDALLDQGHRHDGDDARDKEHDRLASSPEGQAIIEEMTRHWKGWLDMTIPALGNVTPRNAAKTPLGRERLEALLGELSWRQDASPGNQFRVDVEWIRRELGLGRE